MAVVQLRVLAVINNTERYATDDADQVTDPTLQMVDVNHTLCYRADVTFNQRSKGPSSSSRLRHRADYW